MTGFTNKVKFIIVEYQQISRYLEGDSLDSLASKSTKLLEPGVSSHWNQQFQPLKPGVSYVGTESFTHWNCWFRPLKLMVSDG
ncbi:hypothetical protein [uncultured Bacteroides sp.]|uniref:hypothetical protein n=1 Tax=uncultured Bacteroides sp. TaxID=162156 RepID=UPI0025FDE30A|nr:hypothetical protein [uncultured Bacteroides sp.]